MFKTSQAVIDLFNKNYRQVIRITFKGKYEQFVITENRVIQGGLTIDRYSVSGTKIEIASAVAAELTLKLKNDDGKYDNVVFEGAELFVEIGIKKWDAHRWEKATVEYIPCGYFIVDTPPRALSTISVSALDRMVLFDKLVDWTKITFPITVENLISRVCEVCGVECSTDLSRLVNHSYTIHKAPTSEGLTYRKLIQWCSFITASCSFMDYDGKLVFKWYEHTDFTVTASQRYSSDMYENDITITGLVYKAVNGETVVVGDTDYTLTYDSCELLQENVSAALTNIYLAIRGFTYRPYEATIKSAPFLYPMDMLTYVDAKGKEHETIVTHVTFTVNRNTSIAGSGETSTSNDYASSSGLTSQQSQAIQEVKNSIEVTFGDGQLAALNVSQLLANMLGYNLTVMTDGDAKFYYIHNGVTLAGSTAIYTLRNGTFVFTDNWNNGNPQWVSGMNQANNAVHQTLKKYKVTGDEISDLSIGENHLTAEYLNKVELAIATALSSAKGYTDGQMEDAKEYIDGEIQKSKDYSDEKDTEVKEYTDGEITKAKTYADDQDVKVVEAVAETLKSYPMTSEMKAAISDAVKDFMAASEIQALSRFLFITGADGKEDAGKIKVVNGKPVFEYDTTEGGN